MTTTDTTITDTTSVTTDPTTVTTENKTPETIPYARFQEVNEQLKQFKVIADEYKLVKEKEEKKKLESKGEYEKIVESLKADYEAKIATYETEKFNSTKQSILQKYNIDQELSQFITGSTIEELEAAALLLSSKIKTQEETKTISTIWTTAPKTEVNGTKVAGAVDFGVLFR